MSQIKDILLSTGDIQHLEVASYDIIVGVAVRGAGFVKNALAHLHTTWGGEAEGYKEELEKTVLEALDNMTATARKRGYDAITGIRTVPSIDPMEKGCLFTVVATGTAVRRQQPLMCEETQE
jgi:uncharacterized protein YbjQ (UPF0145 family)